MKSDLLAIAEALMHSPVAPYHESAAAQTVKRICAEHELECEEDQFGNLLVSIQTNKRLRPLVLAAHMDHPGFDIQKKLDRKTWKAKFLGGVGESYFVPGMPLVLYPGRIAAKLGEKLAAEKEFEILSATTPHDEAEFAVWDMPEFSLKDDLIAGRACDDLIGVAAILTTLIQLKRLEAKVNVIGAISRAEEVGFHGALALSKSKIFPKESLIISLETSREMPPIKMGAGAIIRVGDKSSIFDAAATRFLVQVGALLKADNLQFQRALMSGGTCEATAYQEFGYQTTGLCVALGNYHNCGEQNKIAPEFVNVNDVLGMLALLTRCAREMSNFEAISGEFPRKLQVNAREAVLQLKKRPLHSKSHH